ncbi:MAG: hypothetical protein AAFU77_05045 [Myxococcota bacterium]
MKRILCPLFAASVFACDGSTTDILEDTLVTSSTIEENITENTTLSGTIGVSGLIDVRADLVIQPGTTLVFEEDSGLRARNGEGSIACNGTAADPITLRGGSSTPGFWEALVFDSSDTANVMTYCNVRHGGSGSSFGFSGSQNASVIVTERGRLDISNSSVNESEGDGILFEDDADIVFASNSFANNGESPVQISVNDAGALDNASDYGTDNGDNFIELTETLIEDLQTWSVTSVPYNVLEAVTIRLNGSEALTIAAGATLLMSELAGLRVEAGSLSMIGTETARITVRGEVENPGYWEMIRFDSNNPGNVIRFADVSHGGAGRDFGFTGNVESSVYVDDGGLLTLENSTISATKDAGLTMEEDAEFMSFANNTFNSNGGPGLRLYPAQLASIDSASTYGGAVGSENGEAWIDIADDSTIVREISVDVSGTWPATDVPYRFVDQPRIETSTTINVAAGVRILMTPEAGIRVFGTLNLNGTSSEPIVITRESDTSGAWGGIVLDDSSVSAIDFATIEGAGVDDFSFNGGALANIIIRDNASLTIMNSVVQDAPVGIFMRDDATITPDPPVSAGGNSISASSGGEAFDDDRPTP